MEILNFQDISQNLQSKPLTMNTAFRLPLVGGYYDLTYDDMIDTSNLLVLVTDTGIPLDIVLLGLVVNSTVDVDKKSHGLK